MTPESKEALRKEFEKEWYKPVSKHPRFAMFDFLVSKLEEKEAIFQQYYDLWNPVDEFVRNHPSIETGDSVSAKALEMLQQSEAKLEAARKVIDLSMCGSPDPDGIKIWEDYYINFKSLDK